MSRGAAYGVVAFLVLALAAIVLTEAPRPAQAHHLCGATGSPFGPFDIETYEVGDYRNVYARALELAGFNQLFPEIPSFAVPQLEVGPRSAGDGLKLDPYIPPVILKAIAWIESGWAQADYSVPYGALGPVLASHDCGYGIMQVTTGMQNVSGVPNLDQAMIGGHFAFNIARGARILAEKWNQAPEFRPVVGERDPAIIENWYYAVWSYNGFAFKNHPLNPSYSPARVPFSCGPEGDGFGHDRTQYPYQELVFGCAQRPPLRGGMPLWQLQPVHLPDISRPEFANPLRLENWAPCSSQANCAPMDIPTPNTNNRDPTLPGAPRAQIVGDPVLSLSRSSVELVTLPPAVEVSTTLTISNEGTGVLAYRATTSAPWLKVSRSQGVALGGNLGSRASALVVRVDASSLAPGRYTAQVKIESHHAQGAPASVTVTLHNYPDGTLIKGSGPAVYVMRGGLKRLIPNATTLEASGFSWASVITVSDATLAAVPTGNALPNVLATGSLVKGSGAGVYVMDGGKRRPIPSPAILTGCGYGWDAVNSVPDARLGRVPVGPAVDGVDCPRLVPPSGSLVRNPAGTVFLVNDGMRRGFPNVATFEAHGSRWGDVDDMPNSIVSSLPRGRPLPSVLADGNLLKGSSSAIFVTHGGAIRLIAGPLLFEACGYSNDAVYTVTDGTLGRLPLGLNLTAPPCPRYVPPDGTVLRSPSGTVYVMEGGLKRAVPNIATFEALGLRWAEVDQMPASVVAAIPAGQPLPDVLADGSLLKGSGTTVYVMEGGARRVITSATVFVACGYSWDAVNVITDVRLGKVPLGPDVTGPPCPAPAAAAAGAEAQGGPGTP